MATKKISKKTTAKATTKAAKLKPGSHVMYGVAIREAIARGDAAEMRRTATAARKHIAEVTKALQGLEKKLGR